MTVVLSERADLTLEAFRRVAWDGENARLSPEALEAIQTSRTAFMALIEDGSVSVYGVTSGFGDRARLQLTAEERARQAREATDRGVSFGEALPERVTRGIVFARLANIVGGHAAIRPELASAVSRLLDGGTLPVVPSQGNGGSGEIIALGHLFRPLTETFELAPKEGLALINGSPCAAALVADAALAAERRMAIAYDAFALSVEAFRAPLEAYDDALEALWVDPFEHVALRALRQRLVGADPVRTAYQAPVSFRILPRVLGQAERSAEAAREAARSSLASVTDNPVFLPPSPSEPRGRVFSTGGYHNSASPQALDALAAIWADLARLAERHIEQLWVGPGKRQSQQLEELLSLLLMVTAGYCEEATAAAQPTRLFRSGPGQNDVGSVSFLAWRRAEAAAAALDACLAILLTVSAQLLIAEGRPAPVPLRERFEQIATIYPSAEHPYSERLSDVVAALSGEIYGRSTAPVRAGRGQG
jgi:histidine ammonia-lyase